MSLNDPVVLFCDENRGMFRLLRGRETFYNERREMIEFETASEAAEWAKDNLGVVVRVQINGDKCNGGDGNQASRSESGQYKFGL